MMNYMSFHEPPVYIAIGVKWWVLESSVYLAAFLEAARSAAAASLVAVLSTYELAYVSATLMSMQAACLWSRV